ncbi:hypothetical protein BROC_01068 [Candidatus Brocadiaceae bacterium]|nr:hypothetical protein BROC_01068 [Candidatus Brocadiaceae bacterium]
MKEQIFSICDRLNQLGVKPTAQRVRDELGGGSFSTISPILKEWRDSQSRAESVPDIPPEAQNAVYQATALLWKIATDHQAEAINAVRQECNRIEQEAIAERDEALREIEVLEKRVRELELAMKEKASLELQVQKQQMALDSTLKSCEELKAENRELRQQASTAQNEASRLAGMLEAFQSMKLLDGSAELTEPATTPTKPSRKPKTPKTI